MRTLSASAIKAEPAASAAQLSAQPPLFSVYCPAAGARALIGAAKSQILECRSGCKGEKLRCMHVQDTAELILNDGTDGICVPLDLQCLLTAAQLEQLVPGKPTGTTWSCISTARIPYAACGGAMAARGAGEW